jgi:hypothetical protein
MPAPSPGRRGTHAGCRMVTRPERTNRTEPATTPTRTRSATTDHVRRLKTTVSAAYVTSLAGREYGEFVEVVNSLDLRMVAGRLTRDEARQALAKLIARTDNPNQLERLRNAVERLKDASSRLS